MQITVHRVHGARVKEPELMIANDYDGDFEFYVQRIFVDSEKGQVEVVMFSDSPEKLLPPSESETKK